MNSQQTNLDGFTSLNDDTDEAHPNARFSFDQRGPEEEKGESGARHRSQAPNSGSATQDEAESSNEDQPQPKRKELSTAFSLYSGAGLVIYILRNGNHLFYWIDLASKGGELDKFAFFGAGWGFVLCIIAFQGLWKKDLEKIERAYTMVKIDGALVIICLLEKVSDIIALERIFRNKYGSSSSEALEDMAGVLILWILLVFLPTRKVRNTWRTAITPEEEARKEEERKLGHFEKMYYSNFIVLKYVTLLYFCALVIFFAYNIYLDLSDGLFWELIMTEWSFVILTASNYVFTLCGGATFFLQFEGLRRKNFSKILTSIKLMKIWLVAIPLVEIVRMLVLYNEGKLTEEDFNRYPESLSDDTFLGNLFGMIFFGVWGGGHLWYILKVRDTMKKIRHTL